jgi:hypothetical protein
MHGTEPSRIFCLVHNPEYVPNLQGELVLVNSLLGKEGGEGIGSEDYGRDEGPSGRKVAQKDRNAWSSSADGNHATKIYALCTHAHGRI